MGKFIHNAVDWKIIGDCVDRTISMPIPIRLPQSSWGLLDSLSLTTGRWVRCAASTR